MMKLLDSGKKAHGHAVISNGCSMTKEKEEEIKRAYLDGFMACHEGYARGGHYKAYRRALKSWVDGRERLADEFIDEAIVASRGMTEPEFVEGESYAIDDLPDNDMNKSGELEWVGDGKLGFTHDEVVVTFKFSHVEALDVKYLTEDGDLLEESP